MRKRDLNKALTARCPECKAFQKVDGRERRFKAHSKPGVRAKCQGSHTLSPSLDAKETR